MEHQNKRGGRKQGVPNKATANAREAIQRFIDGNADRLQEWLDAVAEKDGPKAAALLYIDLIEFAVPKLARHEHTGEGGGPIALKLDGSDVRG